MRRFAMFQDNMLPSVGIRPCTVIKNDLRPRPYNTFNILSLSEQHALLSTVKFSEIEFCISLESCFEGASNAGVP